MGPVSSATAPERAVFRNRFLESGRTVRLFRWACRDRAAHCTAPAIGTIGVTFRGRGNLLTGFLFPERSGGNRTNRSSFFIPDGNNCTHSWNAIFQIAIPSCTPRRASDAFRLSFRGGCGIVADARKVEHGELVLR